VVGGGYIGVEAAEQLRHLGLSVTLVEALPQILRPFDPEMVEPVHQELRSHGVVLRLGHAVAGFKTPAESERALASVVTLKNGTNVPADVVILALGVRPETNLAAESGLEIGPARGIKVDEFLRTSDPHVWAVGDAIEVTHGVTKRPSLIALAGPANRQGRLVADNIIGPPKAYPGTLGTAIVRVFGLTAACTGANEELLRAAGIPFAAVHLHPNQHAGYFPGAKPIALKLLYSPESGAVLGAQAVGSDGADKRIDVFATAIRAGMTVDDVADLELCYAPPFGSAKDPVNLAGMAAQNARTGLVESVHWHELAGFDPAESLVLDVRDAKERDGGAIPGSVHIPLGELRLRLAELPKDRLILAHCASGQRSYNACRMLTQRGFRCRNLSGSYKTWAAGVEHQQAGRTG
jgi:rhodanese-related sulfurtransferase